VEVRPTRIGSELNDTVGITHPLIARRD
jgi:hypothetical protein